MTHVSDSTIKIIEKRVSNDVNLFPHLSKIELSEILKSKAIEEVGEILPSHWVSRKQNMKMFSEWFLFKFLKGSGTCKVSESLKVENVNLFNRLNKKFGSEYFYYKVEQNFWFYSMTKNEVRLDLSIKTVYNCFGSIVTLLSGFGLQQVDVKLSYSRSVIVEKKKKEAVKLSEKLVMNGDLGGYVSDYKQRGRVVRHATKLVKSKLD